MAVNANTSSKSTLSLANCPSKNPPLHKTGRVSFMHSSNAKPHSKPSIHDRTASWVSASSSHPQKTHLHNSTGVGKSAQQCWSHQATAATSVAAATDVAAANYSYQAFNHSSGHNPLTTSALAQNSVAQAYPPHLHHNRQQNQPHPLSGRPGALASAAAYASPNKLQLAYLSHGAGNANGPLPAAHNSQPVTLTAPTISPAGIKNNATLPGLSAAHSNNNPNKETWKHHDYMATHAHLPRANTASHLQHHTLQQHHQAQHLLQQPSSAPPGPVQYGQYYQHQSKQMHNYQPQYQPLQPQPWPHHRPQKQMQVAYEPRPIPTPHHTDVLYQQQHGAASAGYTSNAYYLQSYLAGPGQFQHQYPQSLSQSMLTLPTPSNYHNIARPKKRVHFKK